MEFQEILQLIFSGVLALATTSLMFFTIALWRATSKYRIATERMAETQEDATAIQYRALVVELAKMAQDETYNKTSRIRVPNVDVINEALQNVVEDIEKEQKN